jgi:hypothetical protein
MTTFAITDETCTFGFHDHVSLDPLRPIIEQLDRKKLFHRRSGDCGNPFRIQKIIEQNSSLRVDFGWSFESESMYKTILDECIDKIAPKYNIGMIDMTSDMRCSWLGFVPFDLFNRDIYEKLSMYGMILYNNEVVAFEEEVVQFVVDHKLFKQHSLTRNERYRFEYLKSIRQDSEALEDAYWQYLHAIQEITQIREIPRDIIEEDIGCHFLYHPALFFELLSITKLKGELI